MRKSHVVATLAACTAGLTAVIAVNRRTVAHLPAREIAVPTPTVEAPAGREAVVLPFTRPAAVVPVAEQPATAARCGDNGGRTKSDAPCGARATTDGRCHHHRLAA